MPTQEAQYLEIKQQLDSYNISTTFPLEMMPLIQNLLTRIQILKCKDISSSLQQLKKCSPQVQQITLTRDIVPKALRAEMSKIISQNNQLHLDIITLKQQLQTCKHYVDKQLIAKSDNKEEAKRIITFRNQRQRELIQQLQVAKFRYNQLIDFVHENDTLQKTYLKKLMNHKKYQINQKESNQENKNDKNATQYLKSNDTEPMKKSSKNKYLQKQKQSHSKINQNIHNTSNLQTLQQTNKYLIQKILNRDQQIQRLQAIISHDGLNLNKVLTQFSVQMQRKRHSEINERITFLQKQNHIIKQQLQKSKKTTGRYQALRDQIEKSHQLIKDLMEQNKSLKRQIKENIFDIEKDKKQISRSVNLFNTKTVQMKVAKLTDDLTIDQLRKKVEFYEKQFQGAKEQTQMKKKVSRKPIKIKSNKNKIIQKDNKNTQTVTSKYENNASLQRVYKKQNKSKVKLPKQTYKKVTVNKLISRIPEESQQQSEKSPQNKKNTKLQQQEEQKQQNDSQRVEQNKKQKDQSQYQQEEDQSLQQVKNQTLIEQYEDTINQLSAKCLQQKEELESKNTAIKALQEIATRLINKEREIQKSHQNNQNSKLDILELEAPTKTQISKLKQQIQQLSSLLNQSQFQKEELRRQFIQMQNLIKILPKQKNMQQKFSSNTSKELEAKAQHLEQLLSQKDKKISEIREDNVQIQDKLMKSLDRIRRLNDQIQILAREKDNLIKELQLSSLKLKQMHQQLKKQRQNHFTTIQLNEMQKDQIILLRKSLLMSQNKREQLQGIIKYLKEQSQILSNNQS